MNELWKKVFIITNYRHKRNLDFNIFFLLIDVVIISLVPNIIAIILILKILF